MDLPRTASQTRICAPVFVPSALLVLALLAFGILYPDAASRWFPAALRAVTVHFGWGYVVSVSFFIGFLGWVISGPWAELRLGPDDEAPRFGRATWFSMLFSAGMGIGMLFYGVAEPISHYLHPPTGAPGSVEAAARAVPLTLFHWGLHAWSIYALLGLAIAYFAFRQGLPLAVRSVLYPLLGKRIFGFPGHLVDVVAVVGTLLGLATSLGLGARQVSSGLHYLFGADNTLPTQLAIIAIVTAAATISLVSGVDRGIRRLSELNLALAGLLLVFVFLAGPTQVLVNALVHNLGQYASVFFAQSLNLDPRGDQGWRQTWTLFYWGWWIAWAPFVGTFVARISQGRTIREFVLGVALVPTAMTFVWFTVFGETALHMELSPSGGHVGRAVEADVSTAIYIVLDGLPWAGPMSLLVTLVVCVFFVTSSDSASFVVDMLTSGGHPNPPVAQRVFWAVTEGAVAATLLAVAGKSGLEALQTGVVCVGAPFCVILLLACWSLFRALRAEALSPAPAPKTVGLDKN